METLKTLGAALMIDEIKGHLEWLVAGARDLEIQDFCDYNCLDGDWKKRLSEAKTLLAGYPGRIGMHGPFWGLNLANPDPLVRESVQKRLSQALSIAEALGCSHMVIHSPIEPWLHRHIVHNSAERERVMDFMQQTLGELLEHARSVNCTLVLENIMDIDPKLQLELIKSLNSPAIKMSIDIGHAMCMHRLHGAPTPDQFILQAGDDLAHVHLQDTDGYLDRHWLPGQGDINFKAVFAAIAATASQPRLIIEVKDKDQCQQSASWLMEQMKQA